MTIDRDLPSVVDARAVQLLRRAGDLTVPPPPRVWDGLVEMLRSDPGPAVQHDVPDLDARRGGHRVRKSSRRQARLRGSSGAWGSPYALLAAAAVGAVVVVTGDWAMDRSSPQDEVLASAGLGPVAADSGSDSDADSETAGLSARAQVVTHEGRRVLRVDLDDAVATSSGYLEVWLLRSDVSGMVTLGVLEGTHAELVLPEGVSLEEYPVVDVSVEAVDGDPSHGGRSVLRGQLRAGEAPVSAPAARSR